MLLALLVLVVYAWLVIRTEQTRAGCRQAEMASIGKCEHKNDRNPFNLK